VSHRSILHGDVVSRRAIGVRRALVPQRWHPCTESPERLLEWASVFA